MKQKILFLGRFPEPFHGAAKMNQDYFNSKLINEQFQLRKIKINYFDSLVEIGEFSFKKFFGFFHIFFKLLHSLIFYKPNLVFFEIAPKGIAFYRDSIYAILCKMFRRKIIFCFQAKGVSDATRRKLTLFYYKFVFKNTRAIILSNLLYYDIEKIVPKNKVYILPNNTGDEITDNQFREIIKERNNNKKISLLYLSNMIESKGPLDVLKICNELKKHNVNFECNFVGKFQEIKFENKFNKMLKKLKIEKYCKYVGPKYGKEKQKILEKTNYLIFPTKYPYETFGIVIIEAFMFGIPVLSYNTASIPEIISDKKFGYVSVKNNWMDLANELMRRVKVKENPSEIREYFKRNYTLKIAEKKLKNIFQTEISNNFQ